MFLLELIRDVLMVDIFTIVNKITSGEILFSPLYFKGL